MWKSKLLLLSEIICSSIFSFDKSPIERYLSTCTETIRRFKCFGAFLFNAKLSSLPPGKKLREISLYRKPFFAITRHLPRWLREKYWHWRGEPEQNRKLRGISPFAWQNKWEFFKASLHCIDGVAGEVMILDQSRRNFSCFWSLSEVSTLLAYW